MIPIAQIADDLTGRMNAAHLVSGTPPDGRRANARMPVVKANGAS
jgi:hypothetical protein